jgi:hypothetical protein
VTGEVTPALASEPGGAPETDRYSR